MVYWLIAGNVLWFVIAVLFIRYSNKLNDKLDIKSMVMCDIYETAHNASTGPAAPDTYWEIRQLAEPEI